MLSVLVRGPEPLKAVLDIAASVRLAARTKDITPHAGNIVRRDGGAGGASK
jgi:hypothetical protein